MTNTGPDTDANDGPTGPVGHDYLTDLPLPDVVNWPIFPFKGDLQVRTVRPFSEAERVRSGEPGGPPCGCPDDPNGDERAPALWSDERWAVRPIRFGDRPAPFPAYMLETVAHIDFEDFDDLLLAEYGPLCARLNRAVRAIGDIGRVHMNRWGDGGSHFHVWFLGRPFGAGQLSGFALPYWGFILPPLPEHTHRANDRLVGRALAAAGGSLAPSGS